MTTSFHDFLEGNMLGDGCVYIPNNGINARYQHGSKYKILLEYYKDFFNKYGIVGSGKIYDHISSFGHSYQFNTRAYIELTFYRKRWYPNGKKIVPEDLELTSDVLLWWYIGDGSCNLTNITATSQLILHTEGFNETHINLLIKKLKEKGINSKKWKKIKNQFVIGIKASSVRKFFEFMTPLPQKLENIYGYKWRYQISRRLRGNI